MLLGAALLRIRLAERPDPRPGLEVLGPPRELGLGNELMASAVIVPLAPTWRPPAAPADRQSLGRIERLGWHPT